MKSPVCRIAHLRSLVKKVSARQTRAETDFEADPTTITQATVALCDAEPAEGEVHRVTVRIGKMAARRHGGESAEDGVCNADSHPAW